jgi:DNA-binding transcriptional regulator YhcF (GntR family)
MVIEVDPASPVPPYEQIRSQVATMIGTGTLPEGAQLPPIRQLAADLGIAANTVARAYRELESEGLVSSRVRHGTVVADGHAVLSAVEVRQLLLNAANGYAATVRRLGVDSEEALRAARTALEAQPQARQS